MIDPPKWESVGMECTGCGMTVSPVLAAKGPYLMEGHPPISSKQKHTADRCAEERARRSIKTSPLGLLDVLLDQCGAKRAQLSVGGSQGGETADRVWEASCWIEGQEDWQTRRSPDPEEAMRALLEVVFSEMKGSLHPASEAQLLALLGE